MTAELVVARNEKATDKVYALGYRFGNPKILESEPKASVAITFGVIIGVDENRRSERKELSFTYALEPARHWQPGVSETAGLFRGRLIPEGGVEDSTFLERNIADLVTMYICKAAQEPGAVIMVKGPPLAKIIGRIAYRNLHRSVTIAFFAPDTCSVGRPNLLSNSGSRWFGPIPSLHEDALLRTFYSAGPAGPKQIVRLDMFSQYLGSEDEMEGDGSSHRRRSIRERLDLIDSIVDRGSDRHKEQLGYVPRELSVLKRSLKWTDNDFKALLRDNENRISQFIARETVRSVIETGILGVEPNDSLADRLKTSDRLYFQEALFAELQESVESFGLFHGMIEFIAAKEAFRKKRSIRARSSEVPRRRGGS